MDSLLLMATVVSLGLGTVMAVIAWRLLRQSAERRAARVEALQALTMEPVETTVERTEAAPLDPAIVRTDTRFVDEPAAGARLFTLPEGMPESRWQARLALTLALAACAVVPYALYQMGVFSAIASAAPAGEALPLELMSLRHTVDEHGGFTVTGLVQNPAGGRKTNGLVAVVYLFDDAGRFMATGRAAVDVPSLQAGEEATFTVTIPKTAGVGKYRVGFRLVEGGVVSHVDRRGHAPAGTTEDAVGRGRGRTAVSPLYPPRRAEGE
jgi:hypothetical protein